MPRLATDLIQSAWRLAVRHGSIRRGSRSAARFARFGAGSELTFPTTALMGEQRIEIGASTLVGPYATLSAGMPSTAHLPGPPIVTIGDRCLLGKGIGIVGHERIELGDDVFTGHFVYITDQNHGFADTSVPIRAQWGSNREVRIGSGSWIGHGSVILPGASIGRNVVVGANSVVNGTIPDYSVAVGVPAKVVKTLDPPAAATAD